MRIGELVDRKNKANAIALEAFEEWTAEDNLLCLNPLGERFSDREPHGEAVLRTADNDNGLLFHVEFLFLLEKLGVRQYGDRWPLERAIENCKGPHPGLFLKNPGRVWRNSTHDDYLGIIAGCLLLGKHSTLKKIHDWGSRHGFVYNNVEPEKYEPLRWRQGGDIALYKMAVGYHPTIINFIWMIGMCMASLLKPKIKNSSRMLSWLRWEILKMSVEKYPRLKFWWFFAYPFEVFFWWRIRKMHGGLGGLVAAYFNPPPEFNVDPNHPMKRLGELLDEN